MGKEYIPVGDKVLIDPADTDTAIDHGLYLPQTVKDKEKVHTGKVVKTGPGYPVFDPALLEEEPWSVSKSKNRYFPLQAREGDYCIFLKDSAIEVELDKKKYLVVPHSSILLIIRNKSKNNLGEII